MSVSGIEATKAVFTQSEVYGVTLCRTLIEKGYTREVAGGYVDKFFSRSWRKPDMTITRSSKFLVHSVAVFFSLLCVGHVVSGRVFAAQSSPAKQGADQSGAPDDPFKKPLTLESYKSFYVGGERVKRPDGTVGMSGHLYVEAFIPVNAKPTPIVMLHTTTSGTNFLGRANGEEGWATMFGPAIRYMSLIRREPGARASTLLSTTSQK